jgi:hypothetical protein
MAQIAVARPLSALSETSGPGPYSSFCATPIVEGATTAQTTVTNGGIRHERLLGDSELSYYLPSRANGVNDM